MLSYRHAFHAGNFADVFKHVVLTALLTYLVRKSAPLCFIDTHAGAGVYDLGSDYARKTAESDLGIAKLWHSPNAPQAVAAYLDIVRRLNPDGELARYPGSPWIAAQILRPQDRLVLCELHGSDYPLLKSRFSGDRRVHCHAEDGYRFSAGLVPPIEKRGLVLIDPSYELQGEYEAALRTIFTLYRRFRTGSYALWYPLLDERRSAILRRQFEESGLRDVLHVAFSVADRRSMPGMYGCGVVVINPPWTLRETMADTLPFLVDTLGMSGAASFAIDQWVEE